MPWAPGRWVAVDYAATEEPFSNRWTPTESGDYRFKAMACADTDTTEMTPVLTIHVLPAIGVSIVSPTNFACLFSGRTWPISLALDDPAAAFDHAEFFANGASLGQTTNTSIEWAPSQPGDYTLSARVYDHDGKSYVPDQAVSARVNAPPVPEIRLGTIPEGKTNGLTGFPFLVAAQISMTNPVAVAKVEFFADGEAAGEFTNGPFVLAYIPTNTGPHELTARVTTEYGTWAESAALRVESGLRLGVMWEGVRADEWIPVGTNKTLGIC